MVKAYAVISTSPPDVDVHVNCTSFYGHWPGDRLALEQSLRQQTWEQASFALECGMPEGVFESSEGYTVVWRGLQGAVHYLVLLEPEAESGVELASGLLSTLETLLNLDTLLHKPDEVLMMLETLLPCGQLLIMTKSLLKHLHKEAEAMVMGK